MAKKEIYISLKENNVPTEPSNTVVKKFVHMIQYSLNTGKLHYKIPFMVTYETEKRYYLQGDWHVSKDKHDIVQKLGGDTGEVIYTVYHVIEEEIPISELGNSAVSRINKRRTPTFVFLKNMLLNKLNRDIITNLECQVGEICQEIERNK